MEIEGKNIITNIFLARLLYIYLLFIIFFSFLIEENGSLNKTHQAQAEHSPLSENEDHLSNFRKYEKESK